MTPKEKATELVDKFIKYCRNLKTKQAMIKSAKQCAIITVEEILNFLNELFTEDYLSNLLEKQYWQQVKTEIENL